jgi:hypothetical protein
VGKRNVQLLSAMDDYNRDATWKIIGKGAAQLLISEDAFVCTNCAYRVKVESDRVHHQVKVESDRAHMAFVSAAENREWDKLMVRRPWKLFGASSVFILKPYGTDSLLESLNRHGTICHGPSLAGRIHRPPRRACSHVPIIGLHAEIAA